MTDRYAERLSEYLDNELSEREHRELEAHLATCESCRGTLAELSTVVERARTAPVIAPERDLWPAIAARIAAAPAEAEAPVAAPTPVRRVIRPARPSWFGWRFTLTLPQAAAMAAGLMMVAGVSVWMALGRGLIPATREPAITASPGETRPYVANRGTESPNPPSPDFANPTAAIPSGTGETSSDSATDAAVATYDTRYDATVAELQRLLAEGRGRLAPRTLKVLEQNLATIDRALADARRAVDADPSSVYLRNHLASVMKRKVDLLRTATMIASDQG